MLRELDMQMASAFPTVASFWKYRCSAMYYTYRHEARMELGQQSCRSLYSIRYWLNLAYLDFI